MRAGIWLAGAIVLTIVACSSETAEQAEPAVAVSQGRPTEATPTSAAAASPTPAATLEATAFVETAATATHVPEPTPVVCESRPPVAVSINDRPVLRSVTGVPIVLNGKSIFGVSDASAEYQWTQLFAEQDSLDYTSNNLVELSQDGATATFRPEFPGNYRFGLVDSGGSTDLREVEAEVRPEGPGRFAVRGIVLPDLFRDNGGPGFNINPESDVCRDQAIEHALSIVPRIGNNWIALTPANFLTQLSPTPIWGAQYSDLSLLDDEFYAALIDAAHARGLKVLQHEQDAPDFTITHDFEQWNVSRGTPEYWDAWFTGWQPWVVERAARAERFGVDMFSPFVWADDTFLPDIYPEYADRWREMIAAIRFVYSGQLALTMAFFRPDLLTFLDELDAVIIGMDATYFPMHMQDPSNPTIPEIHEAAERAVDAARERFAGSGVPVYWQIGAMSADGQLGTEDPDELATFTADFQEQALYVEALFQLVADEPWVKGMFIGIVDWFDQFRRSADGAYFDQTKQGSMRSKPAEDVAALWFGAKGK